MNHTTHLSYPDGECCRAGDFIRYAASKRGCLRLGRVAAILEGESALQVEPGLAGTSGDTICCEAANLVAEGVQRLTCTELLAMELLFHLLGRQLGCVLWDNADWHIDAVCMEQVWQLSLAPASHPQERQTFRFDRTSFRFVGADEELPPQPAPPAPTAGARRIVYDGLSLHEGDLIWEEGGAPSANMALLHSVIYPEDEDWQWLYEQEDEFFAQGCEDEPEFYNHPEVQAAHARNCHQPKLDVSGIDGRSGSCLWPITELENECYGKVSELERLALDLLIYLARQHPDAHMPGWETCIDRLTVEAEPGVPWIEGSYWEYQWSRWTLTLSYCGQHGSHIHDYRSFLYNRATRDFTLLENDRTDLLLVRGGGKA